MDLDKKRKKKKKKKRSKKMLAKSNMGQHILILQYIVQRPKGKKKNKGWTLPLGLDLSHALKEVRVKTLKDG